MDLLHGAKYWKSASEGEILQVHNNAFSFENVSFLMRFRLLSTLKR